MKQLIISCLLSIVAFTGFAQDTSGFSKYISITVDKIEGKTFISFKRPYMGLKGSEKASEIFAMLGDDNDVAMSFRCLKEVYCVDENDKMYFLFSDNKRINLHGHQSYNCKGTFYVFFNKYHKEKDLQKLLVSSLIQSIRFETSHGILDVDISQSDAEDIMNSLRLLFEYKNVISKR